jgi:hypothetical protein
MSIEIPDDVPVQGLDALAAPPKHCPECGSDRPKQRAKWNSQGKMRWCMSPWHKVSTRASNGKPAKVEADYDVLRITEADAEFLRACGIGVR